MKPWPAFGLKPLTIAVGVITSMHTTSSFAEELEEIVVTSQKRVQSIREVPISLVAVDGEKIEKMGVENIEDLTLFAPNIHLTETGLSTQLRIRGIGSDNSQGFEQSVGLYKDGIYHGRAQLFRAPMFDVERVEILRGPQSTLFGKNSIAGAIEVITAKPTEELEGSVQASYENEFGTKELSGFVSGPLNDQLQGRVAVRVYDDPGFMTNTTKNRDEAIQDEKALRATLLWSPSENFDATLTVERDTFDIDGRFVEITLDQAPTDPTTGAALDPTYSQVLASVSPAFAFDSEFNYERQSNAPEFSNNTIDSQTLRMDYDTEGFTLTSITGLLKFDYQENCDCDFTPANFFNLDLLEDYEQLSQEIRLVSADDEDFTWLGGIFYQSFDQRFQDTFNVPNGSILPTIVQQSVPSFPSSFAGTGIDRQFEQSADTYAIFAEGTWHANDDLHITVGARFTSEEKNASKVLNIVNINQNNEPLNDPLIAMFYVGLFNVETEQSVYVQDPSTGTLVVGGDGQPIVVPIGHNLTGKRTEDVFTPAINIAYDINDDIMAYAKVSQGYKSGGFDPRSNVKARASTEDPNVSVSAFEFEDEQVLAYELGSKMLLLDNKLDLNLALFRMDYDNLQVSQFDGRVGFNVGNALSTLVQGLEVDSRFQISDHLTGSLAYAYLDFEYEDFQNGNCYFGQADDPDQILCDYTGERGVYTPENTLNLSFAYTREIGDDLEFSSNLDSQWVDSQQVHVNLDPAGEIDPYTMVSLRFALASEHWEFALLGQNLLDEDVIAYSGSAPLADTFFGTRTFYSFVRRPRTYTLAATYRF